MAITTPKTALATYPHTQGLKDGRVTVPGLELEPIYDRTQEHLGSSDAMVIRTRRRAINAARAFGDEGVIPPGVDDPKVYRHRSGGVILPREANWLEATKELRRAFDDGKPLAAVAPAISGGE